VGSRPARVLVLGGTAWLGRTVAEAAVTAGCSVTCLARATSGAPPSGAALVRADRDVPAAYDTVRAQQWDLVVDVAREPGHVRGSVAALEPVAGCYAFVSTGNVYADHSQPDADESAPLLAPLAAATMSTPEDYGPAKVACEQAVAEAFGPGRSLVARAGLIGGPGDGSGRTGYWPWRFAHPSREDGAVLVPDAPDELASVVDVRDLAAWLVAAGTTGVRGTFDTTGDPVPLADHLRVARTVAGHAGPVVPASPAWLREHGVEPWSGPDSLPLWIGDPDWRGFCARPSARARAAGLLPRPLRETLADALAWETGRRSDPAAPPPDAGLSDERERALLQELTGA
jgi:nucleoside-diphosphate-sugar epimerase